METVYLAIRACDNIQAESEDEDSIVDRTIQQQGPEKRHTTNIITTLAYF